MSASIVVVSVTLHSDIGELDGLKATGGNGDLVGIRCQ